MHGSRQYYFLFFLLALPVFFLQSTGCEKEYSYEGGDTTSIIINDTLATDTITSPPLAVIKSFPECALCHASDELTLASWNFTTSNAYVCGIQSNSGFIGGYSKKDFTFFGPSSCSGDTGIVISVYLPVALDQDRYNITTTETAFYYYDNNAPKDIFLSQPTAEFSVTIQSFINSTGIVTGTFQGTVFKANGDKAYINDGRFKMKLE